MVDRVCLVYFAIDDVMSAVSLCVFFCAFLKNEFQFFFRRDEVIQRETEKNEEMKTVEKVTGSTLKTNSHHL